MIRSIAEVFFTVPHPKKNTKYREVNISFLWYSVQFKWNILLTEKVPHIRHAAHVIFLCYLCQRITILYITGNNTAIHYFKGNLKQKWVPRICLIFFNFILTGYKTFYTVLGALRSHHLNAILQIQDKFDFQIQN